MSFRIGDRVAYPIHPGHDLYGTIIRITAKRLIVQLDRVTRPRPIHPKSVRPVLEGEVTE